MSLVLIVTRGPTRQQGPARSAVFRLGRCTTIEVATNEQIQCGEYAVSWAVARARTYCSCHKAGPGGYRRGGGNDGAVGNLALGATLDAAGGPVGHLRLVRTRGPAAAVSGGCYELVSRAGCIGCPAVSMAQRVPAASRIWPSSGIGQLGTESSHVVPTAWYCATGTVKPIERNCFGDRDAFIRR